MLFGRLNGRNLGRKKFCQNFFAVFRCLSLSRLPEFRKIFCLAPSTRLRCLSNACTPPLSLLLLPLMGALFVQKISSSFGPSIFRKFSSLGPLIFQENFRFTVLRSGKWLSGRTLGHTVRPIGGQHLLGCSPTSPCVA